MAIKRWNASTSQWELVGTPGTATPSAIGAASIANTNTFTGQNGFGLAPVGANRVTIGGTSFTLDLHRYLSSGAVPGIELKKSLSDTVGSHVALTSSSPIGRLTAMGSDGTNFVTSSQILFEANGTVSTNVIPGKISFSTVNSSGTLLERMCIDANGNVGIGYSVPNTKLEVRAANAVLDSYGLVTIGSNNFGVDNGGSISFAGVTSSDNNQSNFVPYAQIGGRKENSTSGNYAGYLSFATRIHTGALTERMRINSDGKVDIRNTANPTLRLIENTGVGNPTIQLLDISNADSPSEGLEIKYESGTGNSYIKNMFPGGHLVFQTGGSSERMRILGNGPVVIGHTAALNNEAFGVRTSVNVQNIWSDSTDPNYSTVAFGNRITRANTSAYTFLQNWSGGGTDTEHYLRGDGQAYADGSWNGGGADYAEYFEWADGNPGNEDRRGYSVSLINDKIKIAEEGDAVFGVVSGNPSVVGDDAPMKWAGKYLKDDFGSYIRDEDGYRVLNPEYDEEAEYVSRESRPEWSTIGLMGKLRLRKGQIVSPSWIKMKDISAEVEEWLVK
jgi:hypothetical protein